MGWDSGSRLNLKGLQEQGVVAVRYRAEGCNVELEVLNCVGVGEYTFSPYSASDTKIAKSARDLFAELPIGAARLSAKVGGGRALRTDYMLAGMLRLPVMSFYPAEKLKGDCARATHVVSTFYLGGFAMAVGESEKIGGGASLFGLGAGMAQDRSVERMATEGDADACGRAQKEAKREPLCNVPLRIGLVPLSQEGSPTPVAVAPHIATSTARPVIAKATCKPIPAGTFTMGSNDGAADEKPAHQVSVAAFCMDTTEVTTAAYTACVQSGKCTAADTGASCNAGVAERGNHPINCVDWTQATAYCEAQGQRLPTEEEWEYAARGTDSRTYPWGNAEPSNQLCWNGESNNLGKGNRQSTCTVGWFSQGNSPFGLADMAGNVWEWTSSGYSVNYTAERVTALRVYRGGGWFNDDLSSVRSAFRLGLEPALPDDNFGVIGFRCAGSLFP